MSIPIHADIKRISPTSVSVEKKPEEIEIAFMLSSGGAIIDVGAHASPDQKARLTKLHLELTGDSPNAHVNLKKGFVRLGGKIVKYIENSDDVRRLDEMRHLYHEVLGLKYSSMPWDTFEPGDRASLEGNPPFQIRQQSETLKKVRISEHDLIPDQRQRFTISKNLQSGIQNFIEQWMEQIEPRRLDTQSRKQQLFHIKDRFEKHDELLISFPAVYLPPDLSKSLDESAKCKALDIYKQDALNFLTETTTKNQNEKSFKFFKKSDLNEENLEKSKDVLATELALLACKTREDYDLGCLHFQIEPCKTHSEFFIQNLSDLVVNKASPEDVRTYVDLHFEMAFRGLSCEEDRKAIKAYIRELAAESIDKTK